MGKSKGKKLCRSCGEGFLEIVVYEVDEDGLIRTEKWLECSECSYKEQIKDGKFFKELSEYNSKY